MGLGSGIRDPGSGKNLFRIQDPGVKKAPDPGSGSATLSFSVCLWSTLCRSALLYIPQSGTIRFGYRNSHERYPREGSILGHLVYLTLFVFCLGEFYAEPMRPPIGQLVYLALIWTEADTGPQLKAGNSNFLKIKLKLQPYLFAHFTVKCYG